MKRLLLVFSLITLSLLTQAQGTYINYGMGQVLFGDGDYTGLNFYNNLQFPVSNSFDLKIGIQVANAAETSEEQIHNRHNVFNFANHCNLVITPFRSGRFRGSFSAGVIGRYRSEIAFKSSRTVYTQKGASLTLIENRYDRSYDFGYNIDATVLFRITQKIHLGLCGQHINYNRGSGLYTLNFSFSYEL